MKNKILAGLRVMTVGMLSLILPLAVATQRVAAEPVKSKKCAGVETSIIKCDADEDDKEGEGIFAILAILVSILTYGVGIAATIGVVISGYQYLTARDDMGQVVKAKKRLMEIAIGLVIYAIMWGVIQFLLPGGLYGDGS